MKDTQLHTDDNLIEDVESNNNDLKVSIDHVVMAIYFTGFIFVKPAF